jgi:hypothetical protein
MAVRFTSIKVFPKFDQSPSGGFDVYWTVDAGNTALTFQVSMADVETGPWTTLLQSRTSDLFLLGAGTQKVNLHSNLTWFKVSAYAGNTLVAESVPMDARNGMDRTTYLQYREVLRRWKLTFDKTPCSPGFLFRRKFYGTRCPDCVDEILATPTTSSCTTCFGTGIAGGYYTPVSMRGDWSAATVPRVVNKVSKESPGPQQVHRARVKIFGIPDAKSEDLWVDFGTRVIHLVEEVIPEQWGGSVVTQTLAVSKLPPHHPAYKLQIPTSP